MYGAFVMFQDMFRCLIVLPIALATHSAFAGAPQFEIIDLGTLGGELANGLAISQSGVVVGQAEFPSLAAAPFSYEGDGPMVHVGGLTKSGAGRADGINASGAIVGGSAAFTPVFPPPVTVTHAFLRTPEGDMIDLTPDTGAATRALGISDDGVILLEFGGVQLRMPNGEMMQILQVDTPLPGAESAEHLSENGIAVGAGWSADFQWLGWKYTPGEGVLELPAAGGKDSEARGVNDLGDVVGYGDAPSGQNMPVIWHDDGTLEQIPLLPPDDVAFDEGWAEAINNSGVIVGEDFRAGFGTLTEAWILIDGEKTPLESLIPARDAAEWDITWALDLNDANQITGIGIRTIDGVPFFGRAFLMTPITSPTGDIDRDGTVGPSDLALLLGDWGICPARGDCAADLNDDGLIGPADLALLLGSWG